MSSLSRAWCCRSETEGDAHNKPTRYYGRYYYNASLTRAPCLSQAFVPSFQPYALHENPRPALPPTVLELRSPSRLLSASSTMPPKRASPSETPVPSTEQNPQEASTIPDEQWEAMRDVLEHIYDYRLEEYVSCGV